MGGDRIEPRPNKPPKPTLPRLVNRKGDRPQKNPRPQFPGTPLVPVKGSKGLA